MIRTDDLRLPGVHFLPPPPAAAPILPPLDVAAFVGFAERGPLHTPVALEDADAYRDVFGGDVPLALGAGDAAVLANLPATVHAFFANAGRRCYVVRVAADTARRGRSIVPGVVALARGDTRLATVHAAWEGRWADQLSLASRLDRTALPPNAFSVAAAHVLVWETGTAPQAVSAGDVLRLAFDGEHWLFPVARVEALPPGAGDPSAEDAITPIRRVALVAAGAWRLDAVDPGSPPLDVADLARITESGEEHLGAGAVLTRLDGELALDVDPALALLVRPGDVLALTLADGSRHLFAARRVSARAAGGSPPLRTARAFSDALLALAPTPLPVSSPPMLTAVERLRFDLAVWEGRSQHPTLSELAFNRGHPRFWGEVAFLESSPRYRRPAARGESDSGPSPAAIYRRLRTGERLEDGPDGGLGLAGMAARLAPVEDAPLLPVYVPLGMPGVFDEAQRTIVDPGADGLEAFDAALFVDGAVVPDPGHQLRKGDALRAEAFHRHYVENRRLRGLHSVLYIDEVALLAVPDATHAAWSRAVPRAATPPARAMDVAPPAPDLSAFDDCDRPPVVPPPPPPEPPTPSRRTLPDQLAFELETLLDVHQAMLGMATARSDVMAILSLPADFEKRQCIGWQGGLRARLGLPARRVVGGDVDDLSYAAVYHPWLLVRDPARSTGLRAVPPDGAATGTIAARERERGVWIAPANMPLAGVLGLTPGLPLADITELFERQFNLARRHPRDFRVISAHTLTDEGSLLQISVRRLMILLRKMAAELGMDLVFDPHDTRLADRVELTLTTMLTDMFARGALVGATPEEAFRVVTDQTVNTASDRDVGRFLALIQVAPSQPLEFLDVLLTRVGDGLLRATEGQA